MNKPIFFDIADQDALQELRQKNVRFLDSSKEQIEELCEIRFPRLRDKPEILTSKKTAFLKKFDSETVYCYLPWKNVCIRLLKEILFEELRTARNRNLITKQEQKKFCDAKIAVAGLSVGSNIGRLLTLQGGPKVMNLADADRLSLSNLNRILATTIDLGKKKTEILSENLYEMNPYLNLNLFSEGLNSVKECEEFLKIGGRKIDVLVEEIDSLPMKIELRKLASKLKIPVVSIADNGDGIIVEIERYDQGFKLQNFMKKLRVLPKNVTTFHERAVAVTKFIGISDIETRMLESIKEAGKTLYSWPQLGGAAVFSGLVGAYCVRQIVNGYELKSGRHVLSLPQFFATKHLLNLNARKKVLRYFN